MNNAKLPIIVFISGNGSNLQAIIDATKEGLAVDVRAVVSSDASAFGLERAAKAGITTHVVNPKDYSERDDFDRALRDVVQGSGAELVVLAGFMKMLGKAFLDAFPEKVINIHPSLLPKYPGLHTFKRALEAGDESTGTTIHYVTEEMDAGPIICQGVVPIFADDTEDSLREKVQHIEHQLYPSVLEQFVLDYQLGDAADSAEIS